MKKVIAINGAIGGGKDTVANILASKLNYKRLKTAGDYFREEAKKRGISLGDLMEITNEDDSIDLKVDKLVVESIKNNDEAVIVTRVAAHFTPEVFNIYLDVDPMEAAKRILIDSKTNSGRAVELHDEDIKSVLKKNERRAQNENYRYMKLYNYNQLDKTLYNAVYDTTNMSIDEVVNNILKDYNNYLNAN